MLALAEEDDRAATELPRALVLAAMEKIDAG
jgi:hypothetical protein